MPRRRPDRRRRSTRSAQELDARLRETAAGAHVAGSDPGRSAAPRRRGRHRRGDRPRPHRRGARLPPAAGRDDRDRPAPARAAARRWRCSRIPDGSPSRRRSATPGVQLIESRRCAAGRRGGAISSRASGPTSSRRGAVSRRGGPEGRDLAARAARRRRASWRRRPARSRSAAPVATGRAARPRVALGSESGSRRRGWSCRRRCRAVWRPRSPRRIAGALAALGLIGAALVWWRSRPATRPAGGFAADQRRSSCRAARDPPERHPDRPLHRAQAARLGRHGRRLPGARRGRGRLRASWSRSRCMHADLARRTRSRRATSSTRRGWRRA